MSLDHTKKLIVCDIPGCKSEINIFLSDGLWHWDSKTGEDFCGKCMSVIKKNTEITKKVTSEV
jgi:hypothetical protein